MDQQVVTQQTSRSPLIPIQLGATVKSPSIGRADVASGAKGRALLISPNPVAVFIAYDEDLKTRVYVDQEAVIKYGLRPITYYMFLIARLNTDLAGNIIGDSFLIEYVKLGTSQYQEFMDLYNEMDAVNSILLRKEAKGEYSYLKVTPSKERASEELYDRLGQLDLGPLWQLVQIDAAKTLEEYERIRESAERNQNQPQQNQRQRSAPQLTQNAGRSQGQGFSARRPVTPPPADTFLESKAGASGVNEFELSEFTEN